jgi:hypothetical protein
MADGMWTADLLAPPASPPPAALLPACLLHGGEFLPTLALTALRCAAGRGATPRPPTTGSGPASMSAAGPAGDAGSGTNAGGWLLPLDRVDLPGRILSPIRVLRCSPPHM